MPYMWLSLSELHLNIIASLKFFSSLPLLMGYLTHTHISKKFLPES